MFYQMIDIDEIYLTQNMKMLIPFSIWISSLSNNRPMALRHEDKKGFIAPEFLVTNSEINADEINTWNVGIFIYELIEGEKPFSGKGTELSFTREVTGLTTQLIKKLLKKNPT